MVWQSLLVFLCFFLVCCNVLAVEMLYDIDVEWNASSISVASPLRVLYRSVYGLGND